MYKPVEFIAGCAQACGGRVLVANPDHATCVCNPAAVAFPDPALRDGGQ